MVKNVAFNYSSVEDRVCLRCLADEASYDLWLTHRMLHQLLPELTKWFSRSGFETAQTQDFIRSTLLQRSLSGSRSIVEKKTTQAGVANKACSDESGVSEKTGHEMRNDNQSGYFWLCTKANLTFNDQRLRMKLESEFKDQSFIFSMTLLEASHFLMALRNSLKNTDWSCQWPAWLPLVEEDGLPKGTSFLH